VSRNKRGLGRGLDALLGAVGGSGPGNDHEQERFLMLPCAQLQPGRYQPRSRMDPGVLDELAASIRAHGIVQPIVVRPLAPQGYEIIAGERRWRAAQIAGLEEVPCLVRDVPDEAALALALIENIQREDLNPIEMAQGLRRLIDEFGMTHQQLADAIGQSRSAVTNLLRLLHLAEPVRELLLAGDIEMGHARALLPLPAEAQVALAQQTVAKGWSVRQVEKAVQRHLSGTAKPAHPPAETAHEWRQLEARLADRFGTSVRIRQRRNGAGRIEIAFPDRKVLEQLLEQLGLRIEQDIE